MYLIQRIQILSLLRPMVMVCLLAGCATTGERVFVAATTPDAATIKEGYVRTSLGVWERYAFFSIDNQRVSRAMFADTSTLTLTPGSHVITVAVTFNQGLNSSGPYEAFVSVPVTLQPRTVYVLAGKLQDAEVQVWLEEVQTKVRVSAAVSAGFQRQPKSVYIPIYLPGK